MNPQPIVLMYHGITNPLVALPEEREVGGELYDVPLEKFSAQMNYLKTNGYSVIDANLPSLTTNSKNVIITFDDGELNNLTEALPVLKQLKFIAYFFIIAGRVGKKGYLGWNEVKALQKAGMIIGSHGLSHETLTNLTDTQIEQELQASKRTLEINLGTPIESLSIPRGFCDDKLIKHAYHFGYKTVFISDRPIDLKSSCLSRIAVKNNWTLKRFEAALTGEIPLSESIVDLVKRIAKKILRESSYNRLRNLIINISK